MQITTKKHYHQNGIWSYHWRMRFLARFVKNTYWKYLTALYYPQERFQTFPQKNCLTFVEVPILLLTSSVRVRFGFGDFSSGSGSVRPNQKILVRSTTTQWMTERRSSRFLGWLHHCYLLGVTKLFFPKASKRASHFHYLADAFTWP